MNQDEQTNLSSHSQSSISPQVIVSFSDYEPSFDVVSTTQRLLDSVPRKYLTGLSAVVLTNTKALPRKRRNRTTKARQRKVHMSTVAGLYHRPAKGNGAWVEIFVDQTLSGWEKTLWRRVPLFRESKLSDVLFHEIGHHIHCTVRPEYREREDVADVWKVRLQRNYQQQRYSWMKVVARIVPSLVRSFVERQKEKLELKMLESGQISRAEYRESMRKKQSGDTTAL